MAPLGAVLRRQVYEVPDWRTAALVCLSDCIVQCASLSGNGAGARDWG